VQNGLDPALPAARRGDVLDGDPCSSNAPICAVRAVIWPRPCPGIGVPANMGAAEAEVLLNSLEAK